MTVRVNRIEKYWKCCKVESECSRDKKGEILLKKAVLAILIAGMAVLTACNNNKTVKNDDNVYKYSDYEYKDEAQFYMKKNAAAAEKGYYYLAKSPVSSEEYKFMFYYDMVNANSVALCSNVNCTHDNAECEAYLSDDECLGSTIWYCGGRIYMIEKTKEKDILVSYDKTLRDKKSEKTLSTEGMSLSSAWGDIKYADIVNGYMYYLLYSDSGCVMYKVDINSSSEPKKVKEYNAAFNGGTDFIGVSLASLNAIGDKLYVNWRTSISLEAEEYIVDCVDTNTGNVERLIDISSDDELSKKTDSKHWVTSELFYDKDDNMYFAGVDSSAWCLYRMNLKTQEISEVFKLDNKSTRNYTKLAGYDGLYFYVFDKPDLSKGIKNITTDDKNIVYIVDTNGEIKDTLEFNKDSTKMTADVDILGGDRRYLLVTTTDTDIQQFKASKELMDKYEELKKKVETGASSKLAQVCLSAVLDKADIGTGNKEWIQITPE